MLNDETLGSSLKHVLQTLQAYMNNDTGKCNPSILTLARDTGYSDKCVGKKLKLAKKLGWITISKKGRSAGQAWNHNEYQAIFPKGAPEPRSHTSINARNIEAKGGEFNSQKHPNHVPTNSLINSINNSDKNELSPSKNYSEFKKIKPTLGRSPIQGHQREKAEAL